MGVFRGTGRNRLRDSQQCWIVDYGAYVQSSETAFVSLTFYDDIARSPHNTVATMGSSSLWLPIYNAASNGGAHEGSHLRLLLCMPTLGLITHEPLQYSDSQANSHSYSNTKHHGTLMRLYDSWCLSFTETVNFSGFILCDET